MSDVEINGVSLGKLSETLKTVAADKSVAEELNVWRARVRWLGGFKGKVYVRNHSFIVDEPADLAGVDTAPNAVEYVLGALGGCLTVGFILNATRHGVKIRDLEISLEGKIENILRFFGLTDEGHPGYREISVKVYVSSDADPKVLEEIMRKTIETSPVGNTLTHGVKIIPQLSVVG